MGTYQTNMLVFCEMWPYAPQNDLIITAEILDEYGIKAIKNISKDGVDLYVKVQHTIGRKQVEEWKWITFVESIYLVMVLDSRMGNMQDNLQYSMNKAACEGLLFFLSEGCYQKFLNKQSFL